MLKIKQARQAAGYTQESVSKMLHISQSAYSQWERGQTKVSPDDLMFLAKTFGVSVGYLLGDDVPPVRTDNQSIIDKVQTAGRFAPVVGTIAAGTPILAEENIEGYVYVPENGPMFILTAEGNSMDEAGINDGDFVVFRKQSTCENGEIAAVYIDGEATIKRFYRQGHMVTLLPESSDKSIEPIMGDLEKQDVRILGVYLYVVRG